MTFPGLRVRACKCSGESQPSLRRHGCGRCDALAKVKWKVRYRLLPQEVKMIYGLLLEGAALTSWIMKSVEVKRQEPLLPRQTSQTFQLPVARMVRL